MKMYNVFDNFLTSFTTKTITIHTYNKNIYAPNFLMVAIGVCINTKNILYSTKCKHYILQNHFLELLLELYPHLRLSFTLYFYTKIPGYGMTTMCTPFIVLLKRLSKIAVNKHILVHISHVK